MHLGSHKYVFKLNNPVKKEKIFFYNFTLEDEKVPSFEIVGTTGLRPNHIPEDLMAP
jgi:hypothetical protein